MTRLSAIVLAAGLSQRMGGANKLFLPLGDKPMIGWVIKKLEESIVDDIILVGSKASLERLQTLQSDKTRLVENASHTAGMTSSIQTGVAATVSDGYMICLGDQPHIKSTTYDQLARCFCSNSTSIVLPFWNNKKGNPVIFPKCMQAQILAHQEPEGCKELVRDNWARVIKQPVQDSGILKDIDTKADYEQVAAGWV